MPKAVVDGSNLAHEERTQDGKPRVRNLEAVRRALEERGYDVTVIVDASLVHQVDDPERLEALIDTGDVRQVPAETQADYFILELARATDAIVVSNDRYRQWREDFPWVAERRVPAMIVDGHAQIYEPKLDEAAS